MRRWKVWSLRAASPPTIAPRTTPTIWTSSVRRSEWIGRCSGFVLSGSNRTEPRRVFRRLFWLSHAAKAVCSIWRWFDGSMLRPPPATGSRRLQRPVLLAGVGQGFGLKGFQLLEDPLDHVALSGEQRLGTAGMHATERRLVERGWLHDAPRRELVDHHLDETDLRRGQASVGEELREGFLRGGAVHPHHAPHEMGQ